MTPLKSPLKGVSLWCVRPFRPLNVRARKIQERRLLRRLLSRVLRCSETQIIFRRGKEGKPSLGGSLRERGVHFNLSHSGDLLIGAISKGCEIGVDVERVRENVPGQKIADRFFSPTEKKQIERAVRSGRGLKTFFEIWTKKEALLKGLGVGLNAFWGRDLEATAWEVRTFHPAPGYVGAVAVARSHRKIR